MNALAEASSNSPPPTPEPSLLPGVNVLIEGDAGSGKTFSLGSLADSGVETFLLFTESGLETVLGYYFDQGKPIPENLHWHILPRPASGFKMLEDAATQINTFTMDALFKLQDPNRSKHNQLISLLKALSDFPDDRTGKRFGPVDSWGPDRALALDSLTGINPIALSLVVGGKPVKSQSDWGIAQDQIEKLLRQLTDGCKCHFVLISHVEWETDQLGNRKITVSTLGRALAPKIPPMFSDVVMSIKDGPGKYRWSTATPMAALKCRNLPDSEQIVPSFAQIIEKWKSRGGKLSPTVKQ